MLILREFIKTLTQSQTKSHKMPLLLTSAPMQQGAVSITQKTETIVQRIVVYAFPIPAHKCRNQQEQGALRLVEIRNQPVHNPETEARDNDDSRTGV